MSRYSICVPLRAVAREVFVGPAGSPTDLTEGLHWVWLPVVLEHRWLNALPVPPFARDRPRYDRHGRGDRTMPRPRPRAAPIGSPAPKRQGRRQEGGRVVCPRRGASSGDAEGPRSGTRNSAERAVQQRRVVALVAVVEAEERAEMVSHVRTADAGVRTGDRPPAEQRVNVRVALPMVEPPHTIVRRTWTAADTSRAASDLVGPVTTREAGRPVGVWTWPIHAVSLGGAQSRRGLSPFFGPAAMTGPRS